MLFLSFIELVILKSYGDNIPVVKREWFVWGYDRLILVFATQPRYHCDLHQTRKIKIPFWRKADTMQCTTIDRWQHCRSMIDTYRIVAISWPSYGLTWAVYIMKLYECHRFKERKTSGRVPLLNAVNMTCAIAPRDSNLIMTIHIIFIWRLNRWHNYLSSLL